MPEPLTFLMGKFAAVLPADLRYCQNHMWCRPGADGVHRFGFTAYAIRLMQDVYFLDWCVSAGDGARAEAADRATSRPPRPCPTCSHRSPEH